MRYGNRLGQYCSQTAKLERASGPDEWGAAGYEPAVEIKARKEANRKMIRDAEGNTVVSNTTVYSTVEVRPNDKIDGSEVISAGEWVERDGTVCGWEAYL
jgi:hypothetical protein